MKKKVLLASIAFIAMSLGMLTGCGETTKTPTQKTEVPTEQPSQPTEQPTHKTEVPTVIPTQHEIQHQANFVREIASPSVTREFDERFDTMLDDFSGQTINGTTTATLEDAKLRVLVDSKAEGEPTTQDASIYKMASGTYAFETYDEIGFKMRMVGNKELKLSNLVLALRGDDAWKTYPIKLSEAKNIDGDDLSELTEEFQEIRIAPSQSIEDGNTEYDLADGSGKSGTKVLDKFLGFHLYALDEECSAILEISEVFITKAGEKTVIDNFSRAAVNKTDSTCWWRDSTGFIVRRGVNLLNKSYTTPALDGKNAVALTVLGDTSGVSLKSGSATVAWASLKDTDGAAVSSAVNGAYYSLVVDLEKSGLSKSGQLTIESTSDVCLSSVFTTSLEVPQAVKEYPIFDANTMAMYDNFNRTQSGFNGDYDAAITNQTTIDAGLVYQLSYNNGDRVTVENGALNINAEGKDYVNYKVYNANVNFASYKYMIMAVKVSEGANLNDFRINIGGTGITYWNQMKSGEGLAAANVNQEGYPYIKDGFTWIIIDFAKTGLAGFVDSTLDYYYTGNGTLSVDFVGLANPVSKQYIENVQVSAEYAASEGYRYGGYVWAPAGVQCITVLVEASNADATIDVARFEVADSGEAAKWFHEGGLKDPEGNVISGDTKVGTKVTIDLVLSGMKSAASDAIGIHVHGGATGDSATRITVATLEEKPTTREVISVEHSYGADVGYEYAGYVWAPAGVQYITVLVEAENSDATIDVARFEVADSGQAAKWFHEGGLKDPEGNVISGDTKVGNKVTIDLVASGMKSAASDAIGIHVHGGASGASATKITVSIVENIPQVTETSVLKNDSVNLDGYTYVGWINPNGSKKVKLTLKSNDAGVTLKSIRFNDDFGTGERWFKDGAVIGEDGNPISGDTVITAEGVSVIIDLEATGFPGAFHMHAGGFDGSTGTISVEAFSLMEINTVPYILATIQG